MKTNIIHFYFLSLVLFFSGCANLQMVSVNPEWNPPQGQAWAEAQCKSRSVSASGYDWIQEAINKDNAYKSCMASYGYELCDVKKNKK